MSFTSLTRFPRMESTSRWDRPAISLGAGWHDEVTALLQTKVIPAKRDRYVGKGDKKSPIPAKGCAPGIAPYLLRPGGKRGEADMRARSEWTHLLLDLDAAPLTVDALLDVVERAFGGTRHASWTTWSCKDGYASARVLLPLSRTVNEEEIIALFWGARRTVLDAGLPTDSAKADEPCVDSRCLDGRLFYLPAMPASPVPEDKWGGTIPRGLVSPDSVLVLDVDTVLDAGRKARAADEGAHIARWPAVPVPGKRKAARVRVAGSSTEQRSASDAPDVHLVDFNSLAMFGTGMSVKEWADANLPDVSTEVGIGGWVFNPDAKWAPGDSALNYDTANLHRDENGRLWAKDWVKGDVYVHEFIRTVDPVVLTMEVGRVYDGIELGAPLAGRDAASQAEHDADVAIIDARDGSLASLKARWGKKKAEAEAMSPEASKAAGEALRAGKHYIKRFKGLYAVSFGIAPPAIRCGFNLATQHAVTGKGGSYHRPCGEMSCGACGPHVLTQKLSAILGMPVLDKGEIVGAPLRQRPTYLRLVDDKAGFEAFQTGFRKAAKKARSCSKEISIRRATLRATPSFSGEDTNGKHAYVAFDSQDGGKIAIISTIPVGTKGLDKPLGDHLEDAAFRLVLRTYRCVPAGADENGIELPARVVGQVTSSRGLTLDPAEVKRIAAASAWLAVGIADPAKLKVELEARLVNVDVLDADEKGKAQKIVTLDFVEPITMFDAVASVGDVFGEAPTRYSPPIKVDTGIEAILEEFGVDSRETA